jgi:pilus assembly protein Flp/PilA
MTPGTRREPTPAREPESTGAWGGAARTRPEDVAHPGTGAIHHQVLPAAAEGNARRSPVGAPRVAYRWGRITIRTEAIEPMTRIQSILATLRRESGQGLAEYALILALIAIVAIVALLFLGGQISTILSTIGASI